ncbi:DNA repair protein RadA/Sms [Hydrogenispora ethanolica]|uniref:DNA repair protein RadA n=1 Tax=Hydrogenispora ethanolica TaxID=1082276 RepID=A0A4R1RW74_HYDET|nr:DNA repair protein RadA [Hydrogenispora ethanolica]TCL70826.1 DNA repair protein RadA/Sms [Hydrogenispora ethanolica]
MGNGKKNRTVFYCTNCGHQEPKWVGRCPACQEWGTLEEEAETVAGTAELTGLGSMQEPQILNQVAVDDSIRVQTAIGEFDRLIGGGMVAGSVMLLVGDPGIGKSTLSLIAAGNVARRGKVLYVSGEESAAQTKIRANRLGKFPDSLYVLSETDLERIQHHVAALQPILVVIDSIQSTFVRTLRSTPGAPSQIKECTINLIKLAKATNIPIVLIGQVTKESELAGPRVLEHLVDVVVYLEGNRSQSLRVARVVKNRFGSTQEVALFEMTGQGFAEVQNPSEYLLENRSRLMAGSVIVASARGSRPIFTEIQTLVTETAEGIPPRHIAIGVDRNRLLLVTAVLQRWVGERLGNKNIFVSTAGGIESDDPALDLGIAASLLSSMRGIVFSGKVFCVGELALSGEVRTIPELEKLLNEGRRLGFEACVLAAQSVKRISPPAGIRLHAIDHIRRLVQVLPELLEKN